MPWLRNTCFPNGSFHHLRKWSANVSRQPVYYYRELPCTEFITSVPVTWDETKVLYAKVGEAVVVAKRKGEQWFIGGITGNQPQNIEIDLGFIPAGQSFTLTSFEDGINADRQAMDYKKKESTVNNQTA